LAHAHWRLWGVGGSALARELAAMLGLWQRQVGVGTKPFFYFIFILTYTVIMLDK
jgi:hypothetical protein